LTKNRERKTQKQKIQETGNEYTDKREGERYRKVGERKQRTTEINSLS
jgi:hypothetical protein